MVMTLALYRLGRAAVRRRRMVLVAWIVAAVVAIGLGQASGGETTDAFEIPGVEAQHALDLLQDEFPSAAGTSAQLVFAVDAESGATALTDPEAAAAVDTALADVAAQPDVEAVGELHTAPDGSVAFADVQYGRPSDEIRLPAFERLEATQDAADRSGVIRMELGGDLPSEAVQPELGGEELIGLAVAMVVLLVAFGSLVAMGLPIGLAILGILTAMGLVTLGASMIEVNSVAPTIATMIGLGVGIDYALFIVTRHRENLRLGMTVEESAGRAVATSGAAVLFAGITVMIAISGLAIAGIGLVTIMGLAAALTVAVMVAISLTLLPALLGFAGHKLRDRSRRLAARNAYPTGGVHQPGRESLWHRWGAQVTAHPWRYLILGVAALGLLTAPVLSLRLGSPDNGTQAESLTTRRAYDLLADGFGPGFNGPLQVVVELPEPNDAEAVEDVRTAIAADPGIAGVSPPMLNDAGDTAVLTAVPTTSPQDEATEQTVDRLRADVIPAAVEGTGTDAMITGQTAAFVDVSARLTERLPIFIAAVVLLSFVLLTVVFRSIFVPLKAALMNLLSIGAAYGVIVAVFQWGWAKDLVGLDATIPVNPFVPLIMFAILFGLSMDYEVFLLSRVREEYVAHGDGRKSVVDGLASTARVITSAAVIMISVFLAFVPSTDMTVKMFGLGLAVAVFLDATVVRMILVPSTMSLLGGANWWVPRWLDRILPHLDMESAPVVELEPAAADEVEQAA
jgi:RND superfamily putative drug exporter